MEELLARHRKEAKELQNRITSKKKNATKKTRKGVNDECTELERGLKERHALELAALSNGSEPSSSTENYSTATNPSSTLVDPFAEETSEPTILSSDLASGIADLSVNGPSNTAATSTNDEAGGEVANGPKRKGNRQKARLARRAAEQEAAIEAAAQEASSLPDLKARERATIDAALAERGLVEHEVRSDGHCLYAAMADQLARAGVDLTSDQYQLPYAQYNPHSHNYKQNETENGIKTEQQTSTLPSPPPLGTLNKLPDYKIVRRETASFVLCHADEFLPFLDETEATSEEGIEGYARKIAETATWGGQLEILACARRWGLVVNVLQGDGRVLKIDGLEGSNGGGGGAGEGGKGGFGGGEGKECWLAYYKHSFGLGEHYNSLRRK